LEDSYSHYRNSATLSVFQNTLSCLYETSSLIGTRINQHFRGRQWTLIDVGGGEGIFTAEILARCSTLPYVLTMLDPSEENVKSYRSRISSTFDGIRNLDTFAKPVEAVVSDLPRPNLLLASHSLYAVLDQSRIRGAQVIRQLARSTIDGMAVFVMSSQDSYLYTIKRTVLAHLHRIDRSSYGEDLASMLGSDLPFQIESADSLVDVSTIVDNYEKLLSWLSYFCRVDIEELRPHYDFCNALLRDTAIEVKCLPVAERNRILGTEVTKKMNISESSKIIYHKEIVVVVPSERRITRPDNATD